MEVISRIRRTGMTDRWAACFPRSSVQAAMPLRRRTDILVCEENDFVWITGSGGFDEIGLQLRRIPDIVRYNVAANNTLTRIGRRVPERDLPPATNWVAFSSIAELRPQPAALPAKSSLRVPIQIVRASQQEHPSAMQVSIHAWAEYAITAPLVRLNPLRFAVREDGQTLILGSPVPPLAGSYFTDRNGLLFPCGHTWAPPVGSRNSAEGHAAFHRRPGSFQHRRKL